MEVWLRSEDPGVGCKEPDQGARFVIFAASWLDLIPRAAAAEERQARGRESSNLLKFCRGNSRAESSR